MGSGSAEQGEQGVQGLEGGAGTLLVEAQDLLGDLVEPLAGVEPDRAPFAGLDRGASGEQVGRASEDVGRKDLVGAATRPLLHAGDGVLVPRHTAVVDDHVRPGGAGNQQQRPDRSHRGGAHGGRGHQSSLEFSL